MNTVLWALQILLAALNAFHAWLYFTWSPATEEWMRKRQPGMKPLGLSPGFRNFIAAAEFAAALGLVLPGLTGVMPWLTPLAAAGFAVIMAGAVAYHIRRGEASTAVNVAVFGALSVFVAYMRWRVVPY
jgi:DoxX-like protein